MLQEFIGLTKTKKVIDESYKIYLEQFQKRFPNYFETNHSKMFALVTTTKDSEIMDIGMSKVDDILNDNWGNFLQALLSGDTGEKNIYINTTGVTNSFKVWGTSTSRLFNVTQLGAVGTRIATGTGGTTATRQDINIESSVNNVGTGIGGWNSGLGKVDIPMVVTATTNYSIIETALFSVWSIFTSTPKTFLLSRDNISPVAVIIGQTINVDYQLLLS